MIGLLIAVPGIADEPALVQGAQAHGMRVVRRCVDAVDLLAAATMDPSAHVVVSADLPRLTADAVDRMHADRRVVGLAADDSSADRLVALGVEPVLRVGASTEATLRMLAATVTEPAPGDEASFAGSRGPATDDLSSSSQGGPGCVLAVWGPQGAPGRTTVALGLAEALADRGHSVLLVDADTYAPSLTLALGVVEEASGLIVACRQADNASAQAATITGVARPVQERLHLMGGLPSVDRWPELRSGALERVWASARERFDAVVVDVGFCLEVDADPAAWGRRRNAAALTAVAAADQVIAVADASGSGAARLCAAWPGLSATAAGAPVTVVRNRATGTGRDWRRAVAAAGVDGAVHAVPRDDRALSAAWRAGRTLGESAPRSKVRRSLASLAADVLSGPSGVSPWILASR